ncbi:sugar ABC transporter substrate-binding protein [Aeromicrobium terrae]|nr:sugar ABC transporter substrate-binding protein [Aeromicrobium terrae]
MSRTSIRARFPVAAVVPAAVLLAAAAACSTDSDDGSSDAAGGKADTVQFVNPLPKYPSWRTLGDCMKDEADKRSVKLQESGPSGSGDDPSAMIQKLQQAIANKVDGIVTMPMSEAFTPLLKQAQSKGIVTGTLYGPGGPESGADVNAGPDFGALGDAIIGGIANKPGEHVVGLVAASNTDLGKAWMDGVKGAVKKYDNVKIAGEVYTGDDAAKALPQVNALLTAHPDITDIATHMGTVTPGAAAAIKAKDRVGKTFIVVIGEDNGGAEALSNGTARSAVMQDVCGLGKDILDGVLDVAEGKKAAPVPVKVAVVDKDEVKAYIAKGWV